MKLSTIAQLDKLLIKSPMITNWEQTIRSFINKGYKVTIDNLDKGLITASKSGFDIGIELGGEGLNYRIYAGIQADPCEVVDQLDALVVFTNNY